MEVAQYLFDSNENALYSIPSDQEIFPRMRSRHKLAVYSMEYNEKKWWQIVADCGLGITAVCCIISVFQYVQFKQFETFIPLRYDSLIINGFAFLCFLYLIFNPLHFRVYSLMFYIYGSGNLLDNGNILGFLCVFVCCVFLYITDFFKTNRIPKLVMLCIFPIGMMAINTYRLGTVFSLINIMHIVGAIFMVILVALVFYPRFKEVEAHRTIKYINPADCTKEELTWLQKVLNGAKYSSIAEEAHVSESKIKARMLELYEVLGVHDKTEFLTMYHKCDLDLSINVPKASEKKTKVNV
jgi:DNA-binding CsgD family transcriptional regulator